jgi:threonine dehydrogenase-like Zn-dependent dehydrogenase
MHAVLSRLEGARQVLLLDTSERRLRQAEDFDLDARVPVKPSDFDFAAACALIQSGRFPADHIITHTLPLDFITQAFPLMESGEALKVCIHPHSTPPGSPG